MTSLQDPPVIADQPPIKPEVLIEEARQRQRRRWARTGAAALVVAVGAGISGLSSAGGAPTHHLSPAYRRHGNTASTSLVSGPRLSTFQAARAQWLDAALTGGAAQNIGFVLTLQDLRAAPLVHGRSAASYRAALSNLGALENLPDTDVSAQENRNASREFAALDRFFAVTKHQQEQDSNCQTRGQGLAGASIAWAQEPIGADAGIRSAPIRTALADLRRGISSDRGQVGCYPAIIADLQALQTATPAEIADSSDENGATNYLGYEIFDIDSVIGGNRNALFTRLWSGTVLD